MSSSLDELADLTNNVSYRGIDLRSSVHRSSVDLELVAKEFCKAVHDCQSAAMQSATYCSLST